MFGFAPGGFTNAIAAMNFRDYFVMIIAGLVCSTPLVGFLRKKVEDRFACGSTVCNVVSYMIYGLLFIISVSFIVMNAHNPFIYFNF